MAKSRQSQQQQELVVSAPAVPQQSQERHPAITAGSLLEVIARVAADPSVDAEKMQRLLDMQERMVAQQARIAFAQAMSRLQPQLPQITKDGRVLSKDRTVRSKYAKFESIDRAIRPLYTAEGFAITYSTELRDGKLHVTATVRHSMGHQESVTVPIPLDSSEYRTAAQNMGSTISYGKRYALCLALNIVTTDEDDDAAPVERITLDQANHINDLLIAAQADRAKFLHWLGVPEVDQIPATQYDAAVAALERKLRR